jgi:hypothetical protein
MKNKKSPLKFAGLMGSGMATAGTAGILSGLGGLLRGNPGNTNFTGVGGLAGGNPSIGSRPSASTATDASAAATPGSIDAMEGLFGQFSGRQASLGAAGIYALKENFPEEDYGEESALNFNLKKEERKAKRAARKAARKAKRQELRAYKSPNPPYDPTSGDDGAGGTEYDINK